MKIWGQMFGRACGGRRGGPAVTTLEVSIADSADPVWNVEAVAYTIAVTNTGAADASNVEATITLDASLSYVSSSGTGWSINRVGQVVTATRATLAPGAAPNIVINVTTTNAPGAPSTDASVVADNASAAVDTEVTTVDLVTRDATSGKRCPASTAEWTRVMARAGLATGNPSALWLLQEASGNPADSIGSFTLTATSATYQQPVTGWTRKAITFADAAAAGLATTSASLPTLASESHLVIAYVRLPSSAPGAARNVVCLGATATRAAAEVTPTTGKLRGRSNGNVADGTPNICDGSVVPIVVRVNRTGSEIDIFSLAEKTSPTFDASMSGRGVRLGQSSISSAAVGFLYAASFHLAAAELTDAQIKTLLQVLGWAVAW